MFKAIAAGACGAFTSAYYLGSEPAASSSVECAKIMPEPPLSPGEFRRFPLINVYDESPDTKVFRFAFPEPNDAAKRSDIC